MTRTDNASAYTGSILTKLLAQRDALTPDQIVGPTTEVEDGVDNVARGVFPDELKRTWTVLSILTDQHNANVAAQEKLLVGAFAESNPMDAMKKLFGNDELMALKAEHDILHKRQDLMDTIFWDDFRSAFPELRDKQVVGVRKDWVAVWSDGGGMPAMSSHMSDIFSALTGDSSSVIVGGSGSFDSLDELLGSGRFHRRRR